ncbi:hypothetical protein T310_6277, partial [Rasamsonia emersonii CBS 393.64]
ARMASPCPGPGCRCWSRAMAAWESSKMVTGPWPQSLGVSSKALHAPISSASNTSFPFPRGSPVSARPLGGSAMQCLRLPGLMAGQADGCAESRTLVFAGVPVLLLTLEPSSFLRPKLELDQEGSTEALLFSFSLFSSVTFPPLELPFLDYLWSAVRGWLGGAVLRYSCRDEDPFGSVLPFPRRPGRSDLV